MKNGDLPAMPQPNPDTYPAPVCLEWAYGLTKREQFAMAAMQGLLSNPEKDFYVYVLAEESVKIMGQASENIESILGYIDEPELIHRDNLVLV